MTGLSRAFPWLMLGLAAAVVRLYRLDHFSYWLDEILETYWIRESWDGLFRSLRWQGLHAPLDYLLLKLLETFEPADAARKIPAVFWGVSCVLAFAGLIARRAGRPAGLVAGLLLAFAPYHVRYSQELRPYSLGLFLLCLSLFLLDRYLERPGLRRLAGLYLACVATAYTLYLAALVLLLVSAALLGEDSLAGEAARRQVARKFLRASPLFIGAIAVAYFPWWGVLLRATRSAPFSGSPVLEWSRASRLFSYFGFGPADWYPLGRAGLLFMAVTAVGAALAAIRPRLRFLLVWGFGGLAIVEVLEHYHPTFDSIFHYLPAGMALTGLFSLPLGLLFERRRLLWLGTAILGLTLWLDIRGLAFYFQHGRPDWRPLARFLRATSSRERILVESQYTQLCLGFYVVGPDWLCCPKPGQREIVSVDGKVLTLSLAWDRGQNAWLVLAGGQKSEELRTWSARSASFSFPTAEGEGGVILRHLVRNLE